MPVSSCVLKCALCSCVTVKAFKVLSITNHLSNLYSKVNMMKLRLFYCNTVVEPEKNVKQKPYMIPYIFTPGTMQNLTAIA